MSNITVTGLSSVLRNLKASKSEIGRGIERGLKRGGLFLQRESMKQVPVDLGNLRASGFTRSEKSGIDTEVTVGYTAEYAAAVHEKPMKRKGQPRQGNHLDGQKRKGNYWDPASRGKNKFLEDPMKDATNRKIINTIVKESIKVKV